MQKTTSEVQMPFLRTNNEFWKELDLLCEKHGMFYEFNMDTQVYELWPIPKKKL